MDLEEAKKYLGDRYVLSPNYKPRTTKVDVAATFRRVLRANKVKKVVKLQLVVDEVKAVRRAA